MKVPDNWKHNTNFFNVPLAEFYDAFKGALKDLMRQGRLEIGKGNAVREGR